MLSRGVWGTAWIVTLLLAAAGTTCADDAQSAGRRLAQQVYDRPDGRDAAMRGRMILTEKGYPPRKRAMYSYRLDREAGEVWSLVRFTAPADIADTGLLTKDYPGDKSDQWVYLPALKRARRVPATRKGGRFVGSDLYYEDIQDREVAMDRHRLLGEEVVAGVDTLVLESVPLRVSSSVYAKRLSWIHPRTLVPLRIDFFSPGRDAPMKRLTVHRIDKIQGYWTVMDSTMSDLTSGHRTRVVVDAIVYDRGLAEGLFSRRALEDPSGERRFRP
jgi:hypothetical protein